MTLIVNMVQVIRLFSNLQVIWKRLYRLTSSSDTGTMFQLRNIVNRKNIGKTPKKDVNAHEDFLQQVLESHVLAAAMEYLGMESVDDEPNEEIVPPTLWMLDNEERYKILLSVCSVIVDDFTDIRTFEVNQEESKMRDNDKVLVYAKEVMTFGLLYTELVDAVH